MKLMTISTPINLISDNKELARAVNRLIKYGILKPPTNWTVFLIAEVNDIDLSLLEIRNNYCDPIVLLGIRPNIICNFNTEYIPIPFMIKELSNLISKLCPISEDVRKRSYLESAWLTKIKSLTTNHHSLRTELSRGNKDKAIKMYVQIKKCIPILSEFTEAHKAIDEAIKKVSAFIKETEYLDFVDDAETSEYRHFLNYLHEVQSG